jgi:hypothetical protein
VEELIANKGQSPEELFKKLVLGVFDPTYECGKTRVLSIDVAEEITRSLIELQLLQAVVRAETIEVNEVDVRADHAIEVARKYRRDWMNQRANLVDRWRRLQFQADQLQAQLDVFFSGSMQNVGDNPFNVRGDTGTLRAGVQFDAPFNRLQERNAYRQAVIEYQQARRTFYNFEDGIAGTLRAQLRALTAFQINIELNRLAIVQAASQVVLNQAITELGVVSSTAARDQNQALTDLLNAQNQTMLTFITYEIQRLQLDFAMGTMQLDQEGLWIDPVKMGPDYGDYDPWMRWANQLQDGSKPDVSGHKRSDVDVEQLPPAFMLPMPQEMPPAPAAEPQPLPAPRSR